MKRIVTSIFLIFLSINLYSQKRDISSFQLNKEKIWQCYGDNEVYHLKTSNDGGKTWDIIFNTRENIISNLFFINENIGFAYNRGSNIGNHQYFYKTVDGGRKWFLVSDLRLASTYNNIQAFDYDELGIIEYVLDDNEQIKDSVIQKITKLFISDIYFLNEKEGFICGNVSNSISNNSVILIKTTDSGNTWNKVILPSELSNTNLNLFKIDFKNHLVGYIDFGMYIPNYKLKTVNSGQTWVIMK